MCSLYAFWQAGLQKRHMPQVKYEGQASQRCMGALVGIYALRASEGKLGARVPILGTPILETQPKLTPDEQRGYTGRPPPMQSHIQRNSRNVTTMSYTFLAMNASRQARPHLDADAEAAPRQCHQLAV